MLVKSNPEKWARNSANAAGDYEQGVKNPRTPWAQAAKASEDNFEQGVQSAIQKKSFGKGVDRAGDSAWRDGAVNKGRARYSPGVSLGQGRYGARFAPFASGLSALTLEPRGPKGTNYGRSQKVGEELRKIKDAQ